MLRAGRFLHEPDQASLLALVDQRPRQEELWYAVSPKGTPVIKK